MAETVVDLGNLANILRSVDGDEVKYFGATQFRLVAGHVQARLDRISEDVRAALSSSADIRRNREKISNLFPAFATSRAMDSLFLDPATAEDEPAPNHSGEMDRPLLLSHPILTRSSSNG